MNPWWLILIVPASVFVGLFVSALMTTKKVADLYAKLWEYEKVVILEGKEFD